MGIYIKHWSLADWKDLLKWAKIGANNAMIGEFTEVEELPPHGRLIDADAFCEKVLEIVERQKYDDFYARSLSVGAILREVVRELRGAGFDGFDNAPTIIPAEEGET